MLSFIHLKTLYSIAASSVKQRIKIMTDFAIFHVNSDPVSLQLTPLTSKMNSRLFKFVTPIVSEKVQPFDYAEF